MATAQFAVILAGTKDAASASSVVEALAQTLAGRAVEDGLVKPQSERESQCTVYLAVDNASLVNTLDLDIVTVEPSKDSHCSQTDVALNQAWTDGYDYFLLLKTSSQSLVALRDVGWMEAAAEEFLRISQGCRAPFGFGAVAFTDTLSPGTPTCVIIHRNHLDVFQGTVGGSSFAGHEDAPSFLFQLYRRWDCARIISHRVETLHLSPSGKPSPNVIPPFNLGRSSSYASWTFTSLSHSVATLTTWLVSNDHPITRKLALDIIIPSYRVQVPLLQTILSLPTSSTCTVTFILIIDDPTSPHASSLSHLFKHSPNILIRVNSTNLGASASRNRGLSEAGGEWIHFLDDDVVPSPSLLLETEACIRAHPTAAGFVGNSQFPSPNSVFTTAIHLSSVAFFWDIATKTEDFGLDKEDIPWGVTANLIARRDVDDDVSFDLDFPKTGGGEDIAYCRLKREYSLRTGGKGFVAAPGVMITHPWWGEGKRSYWRFFMWSYGDGGLIRKFPELTYKEWSGNAAESLLALVLALFIVLPLVLLRVFPFGYLDMGMLLGVLVKGVIAIVTANITHDAYRHLYLNATDRKSVV